MRKLGLFAGALGVAVISGFPACSKPRQERPALTTNQPAAQAPPLPSSTPDQAPATKIAWSSTFDEAREKAVAAKQLIMVDLYTEW